MNKAYQNFMNVQEVLNTTDISLDGRIAFVSKDCFMAFGGTEDQWKALPETLADELQVADGK